MRSMSENTNIQTAKMISHIKHILQLNKPLEYSYYPFQYNITKSSFYQLARQNYITIYHGLKTIFLPLKLLTVNLKISKLSSLKLRNYYKSPMTHFKILIMQQYI